ncbi:MAG TPA: hypothetical protein VFW06_06045, partial [Acidimicrobiia bacterium]|nr:hypothetical protein [Acidimicrobiia bacterium]
MNEAIQRIERERLAPRGRAELRRAVRSDVEAQLRYGETIEASIDDRLVLTNRRVFVFEPGPLPSIAGVYGRDEVTVTRFRNQYEDGGT